MITLKEYQDRQKKDGARWPCWKCGGKIVSDEDEVYSITRSDPGRNQPTRKPPAFYALIRFHSKCFLELAGEEYMFSQEVLPRKQ